MKTYNKLYKELCSIENLSKAFRKARKRKSKRPYVKKFEANLKNNLNKLKEELESQTYIPRLLKKFIIREPKTRIIHASDFRDRVVYHAIINVIGDIFEKRFIHDSYASRLKKGTSKAVLRFDKFKRKVSSNGRLVNNVFDNNLVQGYLLKADIKHYFETVSHKVLLGIIHKKIKDEKVIWIIKQILGNFSPKINGRGMPLGNLTSQFFANVYLNELDYFVKHKLKAKYYIRYVDDFVILHKNRKILEYYKEIINNYLINKLKLKLHPDKSKILSLRNGVSFLGYKIFYHYKLLRRSNKKKFEKSFNERLNLFKEGLLTYDNFINSLHGWFGYAMQANTYKFRKEIFKNLN
ncbi:MAG: reverse transcriptase/maturase family protein [Candidatus Nanoarchaeia archaeon]|nr:reverse transcriptase/maturase family protein [Candidatus Nanoarchaeia archaeon]